MPTYRSSIETPLGAITASANDDALVGLWFDGQKYYPQDMKTWQVAPEQPVLVLLRHWLDAYFAGENPRVNFPLAPRGSAFRQKVWRVLQEIPHGSTTSYGAIARQIARATDSATFSAQAVGGAVGHNPISIVIPCHRVIGADGSLTGYAGGIDRKAALLRLEGVLL
jgi:methylated-DNA-[protein]-cysteine S-methyltransferase